MNSSTMMSSVAVDEPCTVHALQQMSLHTSILPCKNVLQPDVSNQFWCATFQEALTGHQGQKAVCPWQWLHQHLLLQQRSQPLLLA